MWINKILLNLALPSNFICQFDGVKNLTENRIAANPSANVAYYNHNAKENNKLRYMLKPKVTEFVPGVQAWKHQSKLSSGALVFSVFPPTKFLQSCCSMNSFTFPFFHVFLTALCPHQIHGKKKIEEKKLLNHLWCRAPDSLETNYECIFNYCFCNYSQKTKQHFQHETLVIVTFFNYLRKLSIVSFQKLFSYSQKLSWNIFSQVIEKVLHL